MIRTLRENLKSGGAILAGQRWLIQFNKKRKRTGRNQQGERGHWRMRCAGAANPSLTVAAPGGPITGGPLQVDGGPPRTALLPHQNADV